MRTSTPQLKAVDSPNPIDFSHALASRIVPRHCARLHLIQVGCGGTGAHLASHTARIGRECRAHYEEVRITFYDHDTIEPKNIRRQQFCEAEVGYNKAEVLAYRLNTGWGLEIEAVPHKFTTKSLTFSHNDTLTILLGCVDNAAARKALHRALTPSSFSPGQTWWLDAGCTYAQAQVLIGNTTDPDRLRHSFDLPGICQSLPSPGWLHPELLSPSKDDLMPTRQTCADRAPNEPQSLTINALAAAHMADYLLRLLLTHDLRRYATYLDMNTGSVRSLATTDKLLDSFVSPSDPRGTN